MLKIYLENGALVFEPAEEKKLSIVSKPNLVAIGDNVKIDFTMSGFVFKLTKHYTHIEVAGTTRGSAVETVGAIGALCMGFKRGGVGGVTPPSKIITPKTITKNGVYNAAADGVDGYNPITVDTGWQPHPDWWDIELIFNDDPDPNKRFILLLSDSLNTFLFNSSQLGNATAYYRTSDGCFYAASSNSITHTFDVTKDKPCTDGYRTRWVMVYSADRYVKCILTNADNNYAIYIYAGGNSVSSVTAIKYFSVGSSNNPNRLLEAFVLGNHSQLEPSAITSCAFQNCSSLRRVDLFGSTIINTNAFQNCYSLASIKLGSGTTTIMSTAFSNCLSLKSVDINGSSVSTIGTTNLFIGCVSLMAFITQDNFTAPNNLNFSACLKFPESSAIDLFNRLATISTPRAIIFGSSLLNNWSPSTKQIATNKGYTLL